MRDEPRETLKGQNVRSCRSHKRCCKIQTVGRWPWKSEPAKECVTTHLPNLAALKKNGAQADSLYVSSRGDATPSRVGRRGGVRGSLCVSKGGAASSADLGGSSD